MRVKIKKKFIINNDLDNILKNNYVITKGKLNIPKIIHQLWIGTKKMPIDLMNTWKEKHPDYEYIRWTEEEIKKRNIVFKCQKQIEEIEEINGKADIMRWEILNMFGGIFIDADSICLNKLDDYFLRHESFSSYENEKIRKDLIATGTMGFIPNHKLTSDAIEHILNNEISIKKTNKNAWETVGPGLLTLLYNKNKYKNFFIFPSYFFLPKHYTGLEYHGKDKIYAYQKWGSTNQNYNFMDSTIDDDKYKIPEEKVSILISSYNTKKEYIKDCLNSIKNQEGKIFKEIVWINDGSNEENSEILEELLYIFEKTTNFVKIIYEKNDTNRGIGYSLNKGVTLCSNELIFKMDSDDIMIKDRLIEQIKIMNDKNIKITGGQIEMFSNNKIINKTNHKSISWEEYKKHKYDWIANHPTLCIRKECIIEVGNYNKLHNMIFEDIDLELRLLKRYSFLHNSEKVLVKYRIHENQVTKKISLEDKHKLKQLIDDYVNN